MPLFRSTAAAVLAVAAAVALPTAAVVAVAPTLVAAASAPVLSLPAFTEEVFARAVADGAPIVLVASKPGCPVCTRQVPVIREVLAADPAFNALRVFQYDQTSEAGEALNRRFGVTRQSTIIVFEGAREITRTIGMTDAELIAREFRMAL